MLLWKGTSEARHRLSVLVCMHVYVSVRPSRQLSRHFTKALLKLSAGLGVRKLAYVHVHACVRACGTDPCKEPVCVWGINNGCSACCTQERTMP